MTDMQQESEAARQLLDLRRRVQDTIAEYAPDAEMRDALYERLGVREWEPIATTPQRVEVQATILVPPGTTPAQMQELASYLLSDRIGIYGPPIELSVVSVKFD